MRELPGQIIQKGRWLVLAASIAALTPVAVFGACEWCDQQLHNCGLVLANAEDYHDDVVIQCDGLINPNNFWVLVHAFDLGRQECQGGYETFSTGSGANADEDCAACGNSSQCHTIWWEDGCHQDCAANLAAVTAEVENAVLSGDVTRIADLVVRELIAFRPELGTVEVLTMCNNEAALSVPYLLRPAVAAAVERRMMEFEHDATAGS